MVVPVRGRCDRTHGAAAAIGGVGGRCVCVWSRPPMATAEPDPLPAAPSATVWSQHRLLLLLAISVVAAALRLWRVEQWSWNGDEARTFDLVAMAGAGTRSLWSEPERWFPLLPLLLRQLFEFGWLPNCSEGWLRLPFAFAGALTVPLLALVGARTFGTAAALLAALLLAVHPWHVAASQCAAPAVVVAAGVLAVLGCAERRWWRWAVVLQLLVAAVHPSGWFAAAALGLGALRPRLQPIAVAAVTAIAAAGAVWQLDLVRPVTVALVLVALGLPSLPRATAAALVVPAALAALATAFGIGQTHYEALGIVGLPALTLLAGAAAATIGVHWRSALQPRRRLGAAAAGLVALLATVDSSIETWLQATLHHGRRPAWRAVRDLALGTMAVGHGELVVAAGAGVGPMRCYLRPNELRFAGDPHPGVQVRPVKLADGAASLAALVAVPPEATCLLVLRADEAAPWLREPTLAAALQRSFVLWRVLPGPRQGQDDTLFVYRRRAAE